MDNREHCQIYHLHRGTLTADIYDFIHQQTHSSLDCALQYNVIIVFILEFITLDIMYVLIEQTNTFRIMTMIRSRLHGFAFCSVLKR